MKLFFIGDAKVIVDDKGVLYTYGGTSKDYALAEAGRNPQSFLAMLTCVSTDQLHETVAREAILRAMETLQEHMRKFEEFLNM